MTNSMTRRQMLGVGANLAGITALPFVVEAGEGVQAKQVTTAGLAQSVLGLMKKAELAGMRHEVEALRQCAELILKGGK